LDVHKYRFKVIGCLFALDEFEQLFIELVHLFKEKACPLFSKGTLYESAIPLCVSSASPNAHILSFLPWKIAVGILFALFCHRGRLPAAR
jgi:hypothetical protein